MLLKAKVSITTEPIKFSRKPNIGSGMGLDYLFENLSLANTVV